MPPFELMLGKQEVDLERFLKDLAGNSIPLESIPGTNYDSFRSASSVGRDGHGMLLLLSFSRIEIFTWSRLASIFKRGRLRKPLVD
jgi:hypothetical protein